MYSFFVNHNEPGTLLAAGGWCLHRSGGRQLFSIEWSFSPRRHFLLGVTFDPDDRDINVSFRPFLFGLYLTVPLPKWVAARMPGEWHEYNGGRIWLASPREIRFSYFDNVLHWSLWTRPDHWTRDTPRWRQHGIDLFRVLAGPVMHSTKTLERRRMSVSMPDKQYPVTVEKQLCKWEWPRWPTRTRIYYQMDSEKGIPYRVKDDACFGMACEAESFEQAVTIFRDRVLSR